MANIPCERFVLDRRPTYPLQIIANRYSSPGSGAQTATDRNSNQPGLTLVLMHGVGSHKEAWEVTIQRLLRTAKERNVKIDDVFSIENPSHGESALLNEEDLQDLFDDHRPAREYARAVHAFLTAGNERGAKIDFQRRRLIGIGHCGGATSMFFIQELIPTVDFEFFIAFEPNVGLQDDHLTDEAIHTITAWTWLRQDVWTDKNSARRDLESSSVYSQWDPRVLDLFIEYGLRTHPAAKNEPPFGFEGVTLAFPNAFERAAYQNEELRTDTLDAYNETAKEKPIHLVWGTGTSDAQSFGKKYLSDGNLSKTPASVRFVQGASHFIVQQKPEAVATVILDILQAEITTQDMAKL